MVIQTAARCIGLYGVRCHGQRATAISLYGSEPQLYRCTASQYLCLHKGAALKGKQGLAAAYPEGTPLIK